MRLSMRGSSSCPMNPVWGNLPADLLEKIVSSSCPMNPVWGNLPADLLEKIVAFLPIASLCRFRAVSKEWNNRICHRDFASLRTRASSPEEYVLVTPRSDVDCGPVWGWEVLDVTNKRSFTLSNDFVAEFILQEGIASCSDPGSLTTIGREILAADGGLLCLSYSFQHKRKFGCGSLFHQAIFVCNPVLRTVKQLPPFERLSERSPRVVMSTDTVSMEYEIIFLNVTDDISLPNAVHVYDSRTATWRAPFVVPEHLNTPSSFSRTCPVSTVFKDEFYGLYLRDGNDYLRAGLVSYNKVTGAVAELGMEVPGDLDDYLILFQLVVIGDRLFCLEMKFGLIYAYYQSSIDVVEFSLASKEFTRVSGLESELVNWLLGHDVGDTEYVQDVLNQAPVVAIGLANSILLCSFAGRALEYDLSDGTWHKYADCKFSRDFRQLTGFLDQFGCSHCLSLCAP